MKTITFRMMLSCYFMILLWTTVNAQTFLLHSVPENIPKYSLKFSRPNFEGDADLSTFSGIYEFSLNVPVSPHMNVIGSVPFTTVNYGDVSPDVYGGEDSESGLGNIFIGVQTHQGISSGKRSYGTFGLFLPTASEDKWEVYSMGVFTNFQDVHKYMPNTLTILGNYSYRNVDPEDPIFGSEIGLVLWIPTEGEGRDTELLLRYGLAGGLNASQLALFLELVGLVIITEDADEFGDRFEHAVVLGAQWLGSMIRPGIFYQLYLEEDFRDVVDGVLGIKVEFVSQ